MKAVIVDDEPIGRSVLREELEVAGDVQIIGEADSGSTALALILSLKPDVVFLDMQLPEFSGIEVARRIRQGSRLPILIMVTAFEEYAIQALDAGAIDYLLKPVRPERLHAALERARRIWGNPMEVAERLVRVQEAPTDQPTPVSRKVVGRDKEEFVLLNTSEVHAFQADGDLVWIVTAKRKYLATQSLRAIQDRLKNENFRRIHRNALVNVDHVRKMSTLSSQRWLLTLSSGIEFVVSKRLARNVRELLG
ncbi:LytR/AlgR family response regulator transcription factor [Paludibaculum fermentans]|uniref:LytR/AlgR family response regulator transcription factor n=1 Tax=Paludibaculum fermentans TaxID=1473598 RepID=UPI003EBD0AF8